MVSFDVIRTRIHPSHFHPFAPAYLRSVCKLASRIITDSNQFVFHSLDSLVARTNISEIRDDHRFAVRRGVVGKSNNVNGEERMRCEDANTASVDKDFTNLSGAFPLVIEKTWIREGIVLFVVHVACFEPGFPRVHYRFFRIYL